MLSTRTDLLVGSVASRMAPSVALRAGIVQRRVVYLWPNPAVESRPALLQIGFFRIIKSAAGRTRRSANLADPMSFLAFLPAVVCLGLGLVPVLLLWRQPYSRAQDYLVSCEHTPPAVIRNSSIAYALQMATFGPFFAWGARGDFRPAIIASVFFGLGVYLIYVIRRPMLDFLDGALSRDRSITVAEFIAQKHGNDPRVRLLASSLTVFAFLGLAIGEAFALAALLQPTLSGNAGSTYAFVFGMLVLMGLYTILSGNSGVMRATQLQLGMLYLGLFGATALLLYLLVSGLRPTPPHGIFAVAFIAACCAILLGYRRSRYVDTSPIRRASDRTDAKATGREGLGARLFIRFEKILNVCIAVFAVLAIVVASMQLYEKGFSRILADSIAALETKTRISPVGLMALLLLPLFYPIADLTNWQRIAAFEKDRASSGLDAGQHARALRNILRAYAAESALMWLFMCMLGAIAVAATATPDAPDMMQAFIRQLASKQNPVAAAALALLLIALFAIALSTMSSLFSASLCAIRYDILPVFSPTAAPGMAQAAAEAAATRCAIIAGGGLCLVVASAYGIAGAWLQASFGGTEFLALLFAFYCTQLSFVPLVLGPIIARTSRGFGTVSPRWSLGVIGLSAATGMGAVTTYLATADEAWLWTAVPACLGSGLLLFTVARLWPGKTSEAA